MLIKNILATGLVATIAATSVVSTADARSRHRHHGGDAFAAGVLGFTAGAFLGSALSGPRYGGYYYDDYPSAYYYDEPSYYYAPAPRVYYRQAPRYYRAPGYQGGYHYDVCDQPGSKPAHAMC